MKPWIIHWWLWHITFLLYPNRWRTLYKRCITKTAFNIKKKEACSTTVTISRHIYIFHCEICYCLQVRANGCCVMNGLLIFITQELGPSSSMQPRLTCRINSGEIRYNWTCSRESNDNSIPRHGLDAALNTGNLTYLGNRCVSLCVNPYSMSCKIHMRNCTAFYQLREKMWKTRSKAKYDLPKENTNKYKNSFLPFVLFNCQR